MRLDRRRSSPVVFLAGLALLGERWSPALIAAAACRDAKDGDRGDGGLARGWSGEEMEMRRGRAAGADGEGGKVFRSGAMAVCRAGQQTGSCWRWKVERCTSTTYRMHKDAITPFFVCQVGADAAAAAEGPRRTRQSKACLQLCATSSSTDKQRRPSSRGQPAYFTQNRWSEGCPKTACRKMSYIGR